MISEEQLIETNRRGLLVGPEEKEAGFLSRCLSPAPSLPSSTDLTRSLFGVSPDWISVVFSNRGLLPWVGGVVTIEEDRLTLQIRKFFQRKKRYLGLYERDEIVAHELIHGARMAFDEPIFEEILAYRTSKSRFRRFWGPIFRSSKESLLLLFTFPLLCIPWGAALLVPLLGFFIFRLVKAQKLFERALSKLEQIVGDQSLALILRLTDKEIVSFSKKTPDQIRAYAQNDNTLRWRQIRRVYFS